jgi:hypothetical protein
MPASDVLLQLEGREDVVLVVCPRGWASTEGVGAVLVEYRKVLPEMLVGYMPGSMSHEVSVPHIIACLGILYQVFA